MTEAVIDDPDQLEMFPGLEPVEVIPESELSADQRRTIRQARMLAMGVHPLSSVTRSSLLLHDDAAREKHGAGLRCGGCRFRQTVRYRDKSYPKCARSAELMSRSAASDVRAWWGACRHFEPRPDTRGEGA